MRKFTNTLAFLAAAAVCSAMIYISYNSGRETFIFNMIFFAVMAVIIVIAMGAGISRMLKVTKDFTNAAYIIQNNKDEDGSRSNLFRINLFSKKYGEYLDCVEKTKGDITIDTYINEDVLSLYTHVETMELIPDILTSLGILGTFIGLVWGLHNFDPNTYETMAVSITSLIGGIKVAFVTSVFGIALSVMFSFWLKGAEDSMLKAYDNFLNKYGKYAEPNLRTMVLNKMAVNQKKQTEAIDEVREEVPESIAKAVAEYLSPVTKDLSETMHQFLNISTLKQQELMETVTKGVMQGISKELSSDFEKMHEMMEKLEQSQKKYMDCLKETTEFYNENINTMSNKLKLQMEEDEIKRKESARIMYKQHVSAGELMGKMDEMMETMSKNN